MPLEKDAPMALTDFEIRAATPREKAFKLFDGGNLFGHQSDRLEALTSALSVRGQGTSAFDRKMPEQVDCGGAAQICDREAAGQQAGAWRRLNACRSAVRAGSATKFMTFVGVRSARPVHMPQSR